MDGLNGSIVPSRREGHLTATYLPICLRTFRTYNLATTPRLPCCDSPPSRTPGRPSTTTPSRTAATISRPTICTGNGAARGRRCSDCTGPPDYEQFKRLIHGLDPHTGEQFTAKLIEDRVPGWDVTASVPKGVTTALERGDRRIRDVIWEAGRKAMAELEEMATTRVRKGGRQEDRVTGNLVWYATEHPETRPTKEDGMPDWDRHIHFVVFNETFDDGRGGMEGGEVPADHGPAEVVLDALRHVACQWAG